MYFITLIIITKKYVRVPIAPVLFVFHQELKKKMPSIKGIFSAKNNKQGNSQIKMTFGKRKNLNEDER